MTTRRTASVAGVLLAVAIAAAGARGDEGPIVVGRPPRPPVLTLDRFTGSVGLLSLFEYDTSKTRGSTVNSESALLQENLTLATGGGIVSKNFIDWHASVTLGLDENWSHTPTENETGYAFAPAYDFTANILPGSIIPSDVYARRTESYVASSFQPLLKNTYSEYGADVRYESPTLPTSLNISHTETTQSTLGGQEQFSLTEDHVGFQTAYEPIERQRLTLNYQFTQVGQNNPGLLSGHYREGAFSNSYNSQSVALGHVWQIDRAGRYTLSESLNYSTQNGSFPFNHLSLGEYLRMQLTRNLETDLQYNYDRQQYMSAQSETQQLIGSFTHRLFESLTTRGQAGASMTSNSFSDHTLAGSSNSDTKSYFGNLNLNYTKKVPYGVLGANLSGGYNQTENGAIGSVLSVMNDVETFKDPQPIIVTRANVDPHSIAVFNASGTRRYVLGTDYTVTRVGNTLQIQRSFAGNINPGDTVRLNYDVDPLPGYTASTTNFGGGLRYDITTGPLTGLGLFGQYAQQDQSTSSSLVLADNIRDTTFGADYRFWKLTLRADYQQHDSTLAAFDAARFSAIYSDRLTQHSTLSLGAAEALVHYPMTSSNTNLTSIDGHLDYQINRQLKAIISARWRNEEDSRYGNTMGFEEQGELRWTIRQTEFFLLVRHTDLQASSSNADNVSFQFGFTRSF